MPDEIDRFWIPVAQILPVLILGLVIEARVALTRPDAPRRKKSKRPPPPPKIFAVLDAVSEVAFAVVFLLAMALLVLAFVLAMAVLGSGKPGGPNDVTAVFV